MGRLYSLELEDFKSFKGKHVIGPFRQFSAIVGPNGSGKSNLMDAISFVLGEKSNNLRVRRLGDLIHGASVDKAQVNKCRVTMHYMVDDDTKEMKSFTRSVVSSLAGEFRIDNQVVSQAQYRTALEEINIFIKAKNFLVYQGAVEQIAMQSPKELTQLFEELSRSCELQEDYDRLRAEVESAESFAQTNLNKRRDIAMEKREAKLEAGEAKKYQSLKDELASKNRELYLVQLFFVEWSRDSLKTQLEQLRSKVEEVRKVKEEADHTVALKQAQVKNLSREMTRLEHKCQREHIKAKYQKVEKSHEDAQKIADEFDTKIKEAKVKMSAFEKKKNALLTEIEQESQNPELNLNPQQIAEYRRLKSQFEKRSLEQSQKLDNKRQEQETDRNALEYENRRLTMQEDRIKQKEAEIEREKRNIENLKDTERQQLEMLKTGKTDLIQLEKEVRDSKQRLDEVSKQLGDTTKQISDAQGESADTERAKRQLEAIESLKRVFPEKVYGRLVDLCQPSHRKFQIAVTKVLGKFMIAIVCDSDETARDCITYLREQHYPPETFLPLTTLDVHPVNEKLREITNPANVKLIFDVINCNVQSARKALQFACGNSLVCETPEHARQLAYGTGDRSDRFRAVALDGTQFQPNGVISGGGFDLKVRAKKWDEQAIRKLKEKRSALQEELSQLHRTRRRELDVEMKRQQLNSLEHRSKFTRVEYRKLEDQVLQRLNIELEAANAEIEVIQDKIRNLEAVMKERSTEIDKLKKQYDRIADEIYAEFCENVGIKHIREYEEREMKILEENTKKMNEYSRELDRLKYELEFLESEDKKANVRKIGEKMKALEKEKLQSEEKLNIEKQKLKELKDSVKELRKEIANKKSEMESAEAEVSAAKNDCVGIDQELHTSDKNLIQQQQIEVRRTQKRHSLLHECKLHGIDIPLLKGSLDAILLHEPDIAIDESQPSSSSSQMMSQSASQSIGNAEDIEVDYSELSKSMKKTIQNESEMNKAAEKLSKSVQEAEAALSKMSAPSTHVNERMEHVQEKEKETSEECENARKRARKARVAFEKAKADRHKKFQEFFEPVSVRIDEIYKQLSQNESAQAFLGPLNLEEPYADGIVFSCIAPGKRFRPMDSLSGGEKTIAALALLFAIHSSNPSPFFVLDEIDAALDNTNIGKVVNYITERSRSDMQLIVISLKEEMYNKADALVGVYPKSTTPCIASGILTFDLENFNVDE
ncbi:SMC proteins flexible hinge domain-containing protein [Ditylenchus destructor]|nr:SMC proteins flexible hinge domain-containing protein [Ditylenchus destructor]